MRDWNPKTVWRRVRRSVKDWIEDEGSDEASDPALMFHLIVTTPLLLGLLALMRRA